MLFYKLQIIPQLLLLFLASAHGVLENKNDLNNSSNVKQLNKTINDYHEYTQGNYFTDNSKARYVIRAARRFHIKSFKH